MQKIKPKERETEQSIQNIKHSAIVVGRASNLSFWLVSKHVYNNVTVEHDLFN